MNGYSVGGADSVYAQNPDLPLTEWASLSNDPNHDSAHYGEAFLFLTYFLDRFGDKADTGAGEGPGKQPDQHR